MRKFLFENTGLKISAVVVAFLLWFFVTSSGQSEISVEVTPEFKNIPAGIGIVNNTAKTVIVTVRGQERLIKSVRPSDVRVPIDLSKAKQGEAQFFINKDDIKLPYAIKVTGVSPSSVKLKLEEVITKTVAVRPAVTGEPEKGYHVKTISVEPSSIVVRGLKSEVRRIGVLKTEPLDLSGMKETTTQELGIETSGMTIKPEVNTVRVTVQIAGRKR